MFAIARRIVQFSNENWISNAYSGCRLSQLFRSQGLKDISIEVLPYQSTNYSPCREVMVLDRRENEALTAGVITQDELNWWHEDLEQLEREGGFFASFNLMLVAGRV